MMEQLKAIKEQLIAQVQAQMSDLKCVDTHELGAVIDMIKDLAKAIYYCEIYEQMEEAEKQQPMERSNNYYYTERYYPMYRDMDRSSGRMYFPEQTDPSVYYYTPSQGNGQSSSSDSSNSSGSSGRNYYTERDYPLYLRDEREGRSPMKRKMYMESKATGQDSAKSMKELESYMQDLTSDMMEMIEKASPEEKAILQKKVTTLASKVQNV